MNRRVVFRLVVGAILASPGVPARLRSEAPGDFALDGFAPDGFAAGEPRSEAVPEGDSQFAPFRRFMANRVAPESVGRPRTIGLRIGDRIR